MTDNDTQFVKSVSPFILMPGASRFRPYMWKGHLDLLDPLVCRPVQRESMYTSLAGC